MPIRFNSGCTCRPLYCSAAQCSPTAQFIGQRGCNAEKLGVACASTATAIRSATYGADGKTVEQIFQEYGVDVYIGAHVHNYERTYPVAHNQVTDWPVRNASVCAIGDNQAPHLCVQDANVFVYPKAPVYITNGAGGAAVEQSDIAFYEPQPYWSQVC